MPGVFLNFRSADAGSYAAVLLDEVLSTVFGPAMVFRSSRSIPAGTRFDEVLLEGATTCDVMLSLIGPEWMTAAGADGARLLDRTDDWVRREISIALGRNIPVIPVLLTGAARPAKADLPPDIAELADRQAVYLRHRHIGPDLAHLMSQLTIAAPALASAGIFAPATALPELFLPSMLLRPEYEVVPFSGRETELAELDSWMADPPALAARLITAPAGQGKTRLALRLCELARERNWLAGLIADDTPAEIFGRIAPVSAPLLLVIDYAEGRTSALRDLTEALAGATRNTPVRLLLLARSAGEWLRELYEHTDDRVAGVYLRMVEQQLASLTDRVSDRHAEFVRALGAMSRRLDQPAEELDAPPWIETERYGRVLDVHAAALAALLDERGESSDPGDDPVARVLHHERRYWRRTTATYELTDPHHARLDSVVAAATLFGAATDQEAVDLLGLLPTFEGESRDVVGRFVRWLQGLYPGPQALNSLRPDRLGEDQAAAAVASDAAIATRPTPLVDDGRLRQALTVLGRGAPRHPLLSVVLTEVAALTGTRFIEAAVGIATRLEDPRPLVKVLEEAVTGNSDQSVDLILAEIPENTLALAELAVVANERALETHLHLADRDPAVTAHLLNRLARRLRQLSRPRDGLTAISESFDLYRTLAEDDRDTYFPHCVSALHICSLCLSDLGEDETAVEYARAAVMGYRELVTVRPDAYTSELANSLNALSNRYRALSRHREAVAAATEATQLYIALWDGGLEAVVMPDLSRSLNNLAVHLRAIGEQDAALEVLHDAIDLRRRLADHQPDAFLADLASSLNNQAMLLEDLDRGVEAAETVAETVEIYRRLAAHRPEVFLSDLAMALNNSAVVYSAIGRATDSVVMADESVALYLGLTDRNPGLFTADLAMALNTKALTLGRLGRQEEALAAIMESVQIRRGLLPTRNREILSGLGASLSSLGNRLRALRRDAEAVSVAEESVAIFRELTVQETGYRSRLANALNNLALAQAGLGKTAESAAAAGEAVEVFRAIRVDQPSLCRRELAAALTNHADAIKRDEAERSFGLLTEALQLCDPAADADLAQEIQSGIDALSRSHP